jgi:hypothetical protein
LKVGDFNVEDRYNPQFQKGALVEIVDLQTLEQFRALWKFVARPTDEQLQHAGVRTIVTGVSFYHGGYVLYELKDVPGVWLSATIKRLPHGGYS